MRHLDPLHAHIEEAQDEGRVESRRAHDRGDADALGRHDHELHGRQIEAGVLHVDKGGVEPGKTDDLDNLRVGYAARMCPEGEPTLVHDALDPVLLHDFLRVRFRMRHCPWLGFLRRESELAMTLDDLDLRWSRIANQRRAVGLEHIEFEELTGFVDAQA